MCIRDRDEAKESLNRIPFNLKAFVDDINEEYTCAANDKAVSYTHLDVYKRQQKNVSER